MTQPFETDKKAVLQILENSATPLSVSDYVTEIKKKFQITRRQARRVVQALVDDQSLGYHYRFGTTYLEKSFHKPVRVSPHIVLHPPDTKPEFNTGQISIAIQPGISFGSGQHPTTQLCLRAIDECLMGKWRAPEIFYHSPGVDIGTGSGVLAIAMIKAGIPECWAYEIDPVSLYEAKKNFMLNQINHQIHLSDALFSASEPKFSMVCANLRWPTLKMLARTLHSCLHKNGVVILSGVRIWEKNALLKWFADIGFSLIHQADKKNWSGFVMAKNYDRLLE